MVSDFFKKHRQSFTLNKVILGLLLVIGAFCMLSPAMGFWKLLLGDKLGLPLGNIIFPLLLLAVIGCVMGYAVLNNNSRIHFFKTHRMWLAVLAGVAVPCLIFTAFYELLILCENFDYKAKQGEARQNLVDLYKAQQKYHAAPGQYAGTFEEMGWSPKGQLRYSYFISKTGGIKANQGIGYSDIEAFGLPFKASPFSSKNAFTVYALANLDIDEAWDVWSIDDNKNLVNVVEDCAVNSWAEWKEKH
jgi:hypothetical protein